MILPKLTKDKHTDNVFAYLRWRGDLLFSESHFCEIDNLILSVICYLNFEGLVDSSLDGEPKDLAQVIDELGKLSQNKQYTGAILPKEIYSLAKATTLSRRFRHTKVVGFVNEVDEDKHIQFSALTYILPDGSAFIAYRGTDDNLVGWKEDFMLAFSSPVPAQACAKEYFEAVVEQLPNVPIRLGGHSKGGNLAFYAAACASPFAQKQIVHAYSNDGPGFMPEFFATEGYLAIEKRLVSFVPQSSIVGALLHSPKHYHIIHSTKKSILQHDPFSWTVSGPHFRYERTRSLLSLRADLTVDKWLSGLTLKERELFVQKIFGLISDSGAKTLSDIVSDKLRTIRSIIGSFTRLEKTDRDMMLRIMHQLLRASHESIQLSKDMEESSDRLLPAPKKEKKASPKKDKPQKEKTVKEKPKKEKPKKQANPKARKEKKKPPSKRKEA